MASEKVIPIKVIKHPYFTDIIEDIIRVPKVKRDGKMYVTYKGESKQVLHTNSEGYHIWIKK